MSKVTRRRVLMVAAAMVAAPTFAKAAPDDLDLFVGTYKGAEPRGVYPLRYLADHDRWELGSPIRQIENISYGAYSTKFHVHYLLDEAQEGRILACSVKNGVWTTVGEVSSLGAWPCYVALSPDQSALAVANYGAGNIVVYRLNPNTGLPQTPPTVRQNKGSGPNQARQEGPHAHWVKFSPDQTHIYSIDLGTDQVLGYAYDATSQFVGEAFTAYAAAKGAGPRHMVFHPNGRVAFLVTELGNTLLSLRRNDDGTFSELQSVSLLPKDFTGHSQAAHIAINAAGTRVYVSNRGHNSLAVFATGEEGRLTRLQIISTSGDWPRFFALYERQKRLVVAHQNSNDLALFRVNDDGNLTPANQVIPVPSPVFIGQV